LPLDFSTLFSHDCNIPALLSDCSAQECRCTQGMDPLITPEIWLEFPDSVEQSKPLSELLNSPATLSSAVVALLDTYPDITIGNLLAAETAEFFELGWEPTPAHRDCAYLVAILEILRPVGRMHGDLPLVQAFRLLAESGDCGNPDIAAALSAISEAAQQTA
jgi:hypothetical protein